MSEQNQKLLDDIKSLQVIEREMSDSLETNVNMTEDEKQKLVERINNISQMRINLYETLGQLNKYYKTSEIQSEYTLEQQKIALDIIEKELNESKKNIERINQDKLNKLRMIEINDYFGEQYEEKANMMKVLFFTMIPILLLVIVRRFIPDMLYTALFAITLIIGSVYFLKILVSYLMRDNMRYQEYDWNFNKDNAPKPDPNADTSDPWALGSLGMCIGQACCSDDLLYDSTVNQCIKPVTEQINQEIDPVTSELTKGATQFKKPDVVLNSNVREMY
jgi:hypothetical protein